ncbi:MAG: sodium:proton antiporter [Oscillatoriales cyanobacterium]|nr:MAG: sodium:proton antiporter [Oscillatoriales cyanobacterium]
MVDHYILNLLVIGILLLTVTLGSGWISYGVKLVELRPDAQFLERLTEFVVIVSLFSCGLKMNRPLQLWAWNSTARLLGFLMPISIFAVAAIAHWFVKLDWGPAILLGAILAPTDPVLASEVQIADIEDRDELRFGLTSEGGLNDALAFPFVYFGIYALKDNNWPNWFSQWVAVDLLWAGSAGIVMGILVAKAVTWIDRRLQRYRPADELMEDFIALSTILLTYSLTEVVNGYGFLAVFVAGIVVQRSYRDPEKPLSQLHFTERIEKLMEVGTILILGSMLRLEALVAHGSYALLIAGLLIFLIRPVGAWISTIGGRLHPASRLLCGWFGIRGVGSIYYLTYAFGHGLKGETAEKIAWITFTTIVISVIVHGISATPLMNWYERRIKPKVPDLI